jgi:hypothetical protein
MRPNLPFSLATLLALAGLVQTAAAQDVLYRCETASGISIQGVRCPKGATQRTIPVERPAPPPPAATPTTAPAANTTPDSDTPPVTPAAAMRGPYDPYPLWQCMRADGSTFDSRDGVPGKQWVVADAQSADPADAAAKKLPAQIVAKPKLHETVVRPYNDVQVADDASTDDAAAPPPGAAPGHWVADSCVQLTPQQACERFAARRDALRKQIYAHNPSERATWAPEEQDLTSMLYANCGM